jgi:hypothetical protein
VNRFFVVVLLVTLAGCSKPASGGSSQAAAPSASGVTVASAAAPVGNACDRKLLTPADLSGVLTGTVTMGPLPGDPQSCLFTAGYEKVTVSVRPGQGDMTLQTVLSGGENVDAKPLAGVGDKAAWTPILHEVNATKNNLLCDIQASTVSTATQESIGALCNKIFAAS